MAVRWLYPHHPHWSLATLSRSWGSSIREAHSSIAARAPGTPVSPTARANSAARRSRSASDIGALPKAQDLDTAGLAAQLRPNLVDRGALLTAHTGNDQIHQRP